MNKVASYSMYPQLTCKRCGQRLWTRQNDNGYILLVTEDGKRHYKNKCNLEELRNE